MQKSALFLHWHSKSQVVCTILSMIRCKGRTLVITRKEICWSRPKRPAGHDPRCPLKSFMIVCQEDSLVLYSEAVANWLDCDHCPFNVVCKRPFLVSSAKSEEMIYIVTEAIPLFSAEVIDVCSTRTSCDAPLLCGVNVDAKRSKRRGIKLGSVFASYTCSSPHCGLLPMSRNVIWDAQRSWNAIKHGQVLSLQLIHVLHWNLTIFLHIAVPSATPSSTRQTASSQVLSSLSAQARLRSVAGGLQEPAYEVRRMWSNQRGAICGMGSERVWQHDVRKMRFQESCDGHYDMRFTQWCGKNFWLVRCNTDSPKMHNWDVLKTLIYRQECVLDVRVFSAPCCRNDIEDELRLKLVGCADVKCRKVVHARYDNGWLACVTC